MVEYAFLYNHLLRDKLLRDNIPWDEACELLCPLFQIGTNSYLQRRGNGPAQFRAGANIRRVSPVDSPGMEWKNWNIRTLPQGRPYIPQRQYTTSNPSDCYTAFFKEVVGDHITLCDTVCILLGSCCAVCCAVLRVFCWDRPSIIESMAYPMPAS